MAIGIFFLLVSVAGLVAYFIDRKQHQGIELRDAMTGEKIGLTKKQFNRYVYAMGTKDPKQIAKAVTELRMRKAQLKAQELWQR